jgi:hypothetical protein
MARQAGNIGTAIRCQSLQTAPAPTFMAGNLPGIRLEMLKSVEIEVEVNCRQIL